MSVKRLWIVVLVSVATAAFSVAQPSTGRPDLRAEVQALRAELVPLGAPTTAPGGGDPDSFGRNVRYDGLVQTGSVTFASDCTPLPGDPPLGPDDRCVTLNAAPSPTSFDYADIGRLIIPGRSTHSLLCHWLTPIAIYAFENPLASTGTATFRLVPYVIVESEVLNDPSLINPVTGLPFNGSFEAGFAASYRDSRSLGPGETSVQQFSQSRVCIAGFLTETLLEGYGLTPAQVSAVFRHDITLRIGVRGSVTLLNYGSVIYGLRVVGD